MKRILLTGVIAAALFASSAFAASFDVNSGFWDGQADISSGSDAVAACTDHVAVDLLYDDEADPITFPGGVVDFAVDTVQVLLPPGHDCKGDTVQVALDLGDAGFHLSDQLPVTSAAAAPISIELDPVVAVSLVEGVHVIFDTPNLLLGP